MSASAVTIGFAPELLVKICLKAIDTFRIMSIHRSKGLEFPMVFVPALEEGTLPDHRSFDDKEKLLEEGRVCYVALTRAMDELIISCVRYRAVGKRRPTEPELQPSRYFQAIQQIVAARKALEEWHEQTFARAPNYDRLVDNKIYQDCPETILIDATTTVMDDKMWLHLDRVIAAIPGCYPVHVLLVDDDGHVVAREIDGGICGDENVIRWLRQTTGLAIVRQSMMPMFPLGQ